MSVTSRQNKLLVAEDWKKIYQSFRNADFQSYDFENLRRTMIDYIRTNYPEDFNDYIESSEYLALIDLIAFLGQSIAFRVDLNARDNFLELSERREAILRLARLISYNAKRNIAAQGLLKFTTISTTENVIDSNGRNISGQIIAWNDPSNANWYDQFIKVMNAAFPTTQQFGNPADSATIYDIPTEQYRFNSSNTGIPVYGFTKTVAGRPMNFEVTSTTFKGQDYIYEEPPKAGNTMSCVYKDDGRGPGSSNSGFFLNFVQGTLNTGAFTISQPSSNESIDIDADNINNSDVWLYKLTQQGLEDSLWTPVSNFEANNIIYNSINKNIRSIYAVITRAADQISLQFSDGTFGDIPVGTFRAYYRISNGLSYSISPKDIRSVSITLPYTSATNQPEVLTITLGLQSTVSNATTTESNDSIKANAPATYYTQNRMVTGEDYNVSPLSVTNSVAKVKSVNRTASGISRYFDLIDPTGKYSSTKLFADDGVIYTEYFTEQARFSYSNKTDIEGAIYNIVIDILKKENLRNFYYSNYKVALTLGLNVSWTRITEDSNSSTGHVSSSTDNAIYKVGSYTATDLKYCTVGSLIKFSSPQNYYFDVNNANNLVYYTDEIPSGGTTTIWAEVVSVVDDGTAANTGKLSTGFGPITLNRNIPSSAEIKQVIPAWRTAIDNSVITTMIDLIFSNKPFGLRYDSSAKIWRIIFESNLDSYSKFSLGKQGDTSNQHLDASWLLLFTTDNEYYTVTSREQRYVFESDEQISFYYDNVNKIYDSRTNAIVKDIVKVLPINTQPNLTIPFTISQDWDIVSGYKGLDGYVDMKKIVVSFADSDNNGIVDDPDLFLNIVAPPAVGETNLTTLASKYIILEKYTITAGQEDYRYSNAIRTGIVKIRPTRPNTIIDPATGQSYANGQYVYFIDTDTMTKVNTTLSTFVSSLDYKAYVGRDLLRFQYDHSADYTSRIDPGTSNIIDTFVLTKTYDVNFRQWLSGANVSKPLPPGSDELYDILAPSLNLIKSISDEVVYHPVTYKILFGSTADPELQASFKVIKNQDQVVSDNDVKARIITAINQFFTLDNWDFGDTFYFSELASYVMAQLAPDISSFVIVPRFGGLSFGNLFEIKSASDELFINGATVADIEIVTGITQSSIKALPGTASNSSVLAQQTITSSTYGASNG